jgi:DNA-binding SARP family transcriptional activator/tetratricopeptide (TPR) repeat protein
MAGDGHVVEFRLLGSVEVSAAHCRPVDVGPPRQRTVLAALLVDAGRLVTWDALVDRVWGDFPPDRARQSLYAHVARVRQVLARISVPGHEPDRLLSQPGGYLLDVEPDRVDLHRFNRLVAEAREPCHSEAARMQLLREAVGLWRGEPLSGLTGAWADRVRQALRQQRIDAMVAWAEAEVVAGDPQVVLGPLTELLGEQPLVEPVAAALMRGLCALGRTAQALECYAAIRQRLSDELGTDPGTGLQSLHKAVLAGELDGPPRDAVSIVVRQAPNQLPGDIRGFVGRAAELDRLDAILGASGSEGAAVIISAISGTAGVGKTTLAVHWAHRVAKRFPDGQLYVNMRGFDPGGSGTSPDEVLRGFLEALGVPPHGVPTDLDARASLYRSLLADRRVLVVLDNARDAGQVRSLLPGGPASLALITSRRQLPGLVVSDGAHPLILDLLSVNESRELLARRLGSHRVAAEPNAADEIIARCAMLPLALAIVAARGAAHPTFSLTSLATELAKAEGGLDVFASSDPTIDVRTVFSWSYQTLSGEAARLFRLLAVHPGPDVTARAAASLAATGHPSAKAQLAELAAAHLVSEHSPGRYMFHDLLRAFAAELANTLETETTRNVAWRRTLDHYLHTARAADMVIDPATDALILGAAEVGVEPEEYDDQDHALAWLIAERPVILRAIQCAGAMGFDTHAWQLAFTISPVLQRQAHWHDWAVAARTGLAATQRLGDVAGQARARLTLARAYKWLGRYDEAIDHLQHALELFVAVGEVGGQAQTQLYIGQVRELQGRFQDALYHAQQGLALFQSMGERGSEGQALNQVGWFHARLGAYETALDYCQRSLHILREVGERHGEGYTLDSLGYAYLHLGQHDEAIDCFHQAIHLYRETGDRYAHAETLDRLGDSLWATGDLARARDAWQRSLALLDDLGHSEAGAVRTKLMGRAAG